MTFKSAESKAVLVGRIVVVTLVEAAGVYLWLRWYTDRHAWRGRAALAVGECLETVAFMVVVHRRLLARWGQLTHGGPGGRHYRRLNWAIALMGIVEIGIWLLWFRTDRELGLWPAAAVLFVLMHLKHAIESTAVCDTGFRDQVLARLEVVASGLEVAAAVVCLALIDQGQFVLAGIALFTGLLFEHVIQISTLRLEIRSRDIRLPRDPRWRPVSLERWLRRYLLTHFAWFWRLVQRVKPFDRFFNKVAINGLLEGMEPRPNPLSTMAPYTSWASLTDRTFSGRHLPSVAAEATTPATTPDGPPSVADVAALFARDGRMRECPKSTVLFAFFAQWLTDGFLRTDRKVKRGKPRDTLKNESTHSIDLSQLYGLNQEVTRQLREGKDGLLKSQPGDDGEYPPYYCRYGLRKREFNKLLTPVDFGAQSCKTKNQLFASGTDVTNLGVVAFNTLFLREHNRIARCLRSENPCWDDSRLFETARNILTVVLLRILVEEYINHITPSHLEFRLSRNSFADGPWHRPNWMAIEFNLLYRWHSLVPPMFCVDGMQLPFEQTLFNTSALTRAGLGPFMVAASSQPAGRIGLFNTDRRLVEWADIPSIEQARTARLGSYNDYRRLCRLPPRASFQEISSDKKVWSQLSTLYKSVEDVEFYVGVFAEDTLPNGVLPELMTAMVAYDAFSQALTSPLLAPRIYNEQTFTRSGMEIIDETKSIADLVLRNIPGSSKDYFVSFSRRDGEQT